MGSYMKLKLTLIIVVFIPTIVVAQTPVIALPDIRSDPLVRSTETSKGGSEEPVFSDVEQGYRRFPGQNVGDVKPAAPQALKPTSAQVKPTEAGQKGDAWCPHCRRAKP